MITSNHPMTGANLQRSLQNALGLPDDTQPDDVIIGPATWIGDRVTLLPGASVGAGTIVAAGAVIPRGSIPPFSVAAGVPARVTRSRFAADVVSLLIEVGWWDWDDARMQRNLEFFGANLTTATRDDLMDRLKD